MTPEEQKLRAELVQEIQGETEDISPEDLVEALACARSCETEADLRANLRNAAEYADRIAAEARELLARLDTTVEGDEPG